MAVTPAAATYDRDTGELAIMFDGELTVSDDISTAGFSAVLPTGYRAVFSAAGETANDGGIGTLTFVVEEGASSTEDPIVSFSLTVLPLDFRGKNSRNYRDRGPRSYKPDDYPLDFQCEGPLMFREKGV